MYHPIVKEQVIPGQLEGLQTNRHSTDPPSKCQALIPVENSATCGFLATCQTALDRRLLIAHRLKSVRTAVTLAPSETISSTWMV